MGGVSRRMRRVPSFKRLRPLLGPVEVGQVVFEDVDGREWVIEGQEAAELRELMCSHCPECQRESTA